MISVLVINDKQKVPEKHLERILANLPELVSKELQTEEMPTITTRGKQPSDPRVFDLHIQLACDNPDGKKALQEHYHELKELFRDMLDHYDRIEPVLFRWALTIP